MSLHVLLGYFDIFERLVVRDCSLGGMGEDLIIQAELVILGWPRQLPLTRVSRERPTETSDASGVGEDKHDATEFECRRSNQRSVGLAQCALTDAYLFITRRL